MSFLKSCRRSLVIASWVSVAIILLLAGRSYGQVQGQVIAESVPTHSTPFPDEIITVAVNVDMRGVAAPDNRLSSYQASLAWNPAVIRFIGLTPAPAPWTNPAVDTTKAASGSLDWNDFLAGGSDPAKINVLNARFKVVGAPGSTTTLDLSYSAMFNSLGRSLLGSLTVNDGSVTVQGVIQPLACSVEITSPLTGADLCLASVEVSGTIAITGGFPPYSVVCEVNGIAAVVTGSTFTATVPVVVGENSLIATSTVTDVQDQQSVCADTIQVFRAASPTCAAQITSPQPGAVICGDSVEVTGVAEIVGGRPPVSITGEVNGVNVTFNGANFSATVPIGDGLLIATLTVIDGCENQSVCRDTVRVFGPPPLACETQITSPKEGEFICGDSVIVTGVTNVTGGLPPYSASCSVNGFPAETVGNTFTAIVVLDPGDEFIVATCTIVDGCGQEAVCLDTVRVARPSPLVCEVQITSPKQGAFICGDSVTVEGTHAVSGGVPPYTSECFVNGVPVAVVGGAFSATIALDPGVEFITAQCKVTDGCGSRTSCQDTVRIEQPAPPVCSVQITSPQPGAVVCGDSVRVQGVHEISGGLPPFTTECFVNGEPADVGGNEFSATIALSPDLEFIIAVCSVTDGCGGKTACQDTVRIGQPSVSAVCEAQITSPQDGAFVCEDSITVSGSATIVGSAAAFHLSSCEVNGIPATVTGDTFTALVPVSSENNLLVATCTFADDCGNTAVCRDSITVFLDDIHPSCNFTDHGTFATGVFTDNESGILRIKPVHLKNATLTVDPSFRRGDKTVSFRIDAIDPNQPKGFRINVTDMCGNIFSCDPVLLTLSTDNGPRRFDFTFPQEDRYLQLANHGLSEIHLVLNGNRFSLFSDVQRAQQTFNAFVMPVDGTVTIDLNPYLFEGENELSITFAGNPGSEASFMLVDMTTNRVDYVLELQALPETFSLAQNYPNPFNPTTNIRFDIPQTIPNGVPVQLRIFNLMGEVVKTFSEETKLPGRYVVQWDGRNDRGELVATGVYIYQLVAGSFRETKRMTLVK